MYPSTRLTFLPARTGSFDEYIALEGVVKSFGRLVDYVTMKTRNRARDYKVLNEEGVGILERK